jgi:hypothetical protein
MASKFPNIYGTHWGKWKLDSKYFSASQMNLIGYDWAAYWLGSYFSVERATEYNSGFRQALQEVIEQHLEWTNLKIRFDGPLRELWEVASFDPPLLRDMSWLHGTSEAAWECIWREGILPRERSGAKAAYGAQYQCGAGDPRRIYLTTQQDMAKFAARDAGRAVRSRPVLLEVSGLNPAYMVPDEDSGQPTPELSLWTLGSIGYMAPIPRENVRLAYYLDDDNTWRRAFHDV